MLVLFSTMFTILQRDEPVSTGTSLWTETGCARVASVQRSAAICNVATRINTQIQVASRTLDVDAFRRRRVQWFSLARAQ